MNTLYLYLNYVCNNRCRFCSLGILMDNIYASQNTDHFISILKTGRDSHDCVVFTGGEPALSKDLIGLATHAKNQGYQQIELHTNGRLFSYPEFERKVAGSDITHFVINICGHTAEIHDYTTQFPGSFEQTVRGIKNLLRFHKNVTADVVITKINYRYLESVCSFLNGMGVRCIKLSFVEPAGYAYINFKDIVPRLSEVKKHLKKALFFAEKNRTEVCTEGVPYCFLEGYSRCVMEAHEGSGVKDTRMREDKTKISECKSCIHNTECEGIWKVYLMKFGKSEIKPIIRKKWI